MIETVGIKVARDPFGVRDRLNVLIYSHDPQARRTYVAQPVVMKEHDPAVYMEPTAEIAVEDAQSLVNQLWELGIRPSQAAGSAGQLEAVNRHLGDLRTLLFQSLNIKEGKP